MKKILAIILAVTLFVGHVSPLALAQEAPVAPTQETAPTAPTSPSTPEAPTAPSAPSTPGSQTTPAPTNAPEPTRQPRQRSNQESNDITPTPTPNTQSAAGTTAATSPTPTPTTSTSNDGAVGDTRVATGDANSSATMVTTGNTNSSQGPTIGSGDETGVTVGGNGANSDNTSSIGISDSQTTIQDNNATVNNDLEQHASSGNNESSNNVGNTFIKTGDSNVSGTVVTAVNTNVDGVVVSEFNIADDHRGDIILDFGSNCISGCGTGTNVQTTGNGANSTNTTNVDTENTDVTFQTNDASVGNNLTLSADSGTNTASANTNGDSAIYTGDANVSANVLTFANNNLAGNVVYGVVNIYGDLVGDILFPEEQLSSCCATNSTSVQTSGNGTNSTNTTNVNNETNNQAFQTNDATIDNNLVFDAQTGNNELSGNTNGDNRVITGDSSVTANVVNVANSNIDGGNMWLVIVNEAGQWIGRILGAPEGSNIAGSSGTTITTDEHGNVVATNGNGANSTNTTNVNNETNNTTVQANTANVQNTLNLSANTGNNEASNNTGGDNIVKTGDANIVANMVNFVNNNITGGGKLFVTVVNVFGSWLGDFVTPGQKQTEKTVAAGPQSEQQNQTTTHIGGSNITTQENIISEENTMVTPTPVTSIPTTIAKLARVLGTKTSNKTIQTNDTLDITEEHEEVETFDAPEATITPIVAAKNVMSINLAWLILLIPCGIILFTVRTVVRKIKR